MFTKEELEAMRLADEEIDRDFEESEDEILESDFTRYLCKGNWCLHKYSL